MVEGKLLEVNSPSGRVPGRSLLVLPISEARRRRNRGEVAKRVLFSRVSQDGEYIGEGGQPGGPPGVQAPPWRGQPLGRATRAPRPLVVALWLHSGSSGRFFCADFLSDFSEIFRALFIWGKTEIEKQQKTGTGTVVH